MKRIPKQRTLYSNYDLTETFPDAEIKSILIDLERYTTEEEITDSAIWEERYIQDEIDWEYVRNELISFFKYKGNKWMIFGEVGRWDGVHKAGTLFETFEEFFYDATKDCDYIHFYDENGHLYLTCSHHDGTCHFEIKELTDKGIEYLNNWEDNWNDKRTKQYVHTQLFNRYSRLPRFAERMWGASKVEYDTITKSVLIDRLNNKAKSFYS